MLWNTIVVTVDSMNDSIIVSDQAACRHYVSPMCCDVPNYTGNSVSVNEYPYKMQGYSATVDFYGLTM